MAGVLSSANLELDLALVECEQAGLDVVAGNDGARAMRPNADGGNGQKPAGRLAPGTWTMLPTDWIVRDDILSRLDGSDAKVYLAVLAHSFWADVGLASVSYTQIAREAGVCRRQVQRSVANLANHGLLKVVAAGDGRSSTQYEVITTAGEGGHGGPPSKKRRTQEKIRSAGPCAKPDPWEGMPVRRRSAALRNLTGNSDVLWPDATPTQRDELVRRWRVAG